MRRASLAARPAAALALALFVSTSALAQRFWIDKPYVEWSEQEVSKLLGDSPWARRQMIIRPIIPASGPIVESSSVRDRTDRGMPPNGEVFPQIAYTAQVLSALPIRQALVRQKRLDPEFARLAGEARRDAEASQAAYLAESYADTIVLRVIYSTNVKAIEADLTDYWQKRLVDQYKHDMYLVTSSGRYGPTSARAADAPGGAFVLTFPRTDKGQPIIHAGDKQFVLDFASPRFDQIPAEHVRLAFATKAMVIGGQPVF